MAQPQYPEPTKVDLGHFNSPPPYYEATHQGPPPPAGFIHPPQPQPQPQGPVLQQPVPMTTTTHIIVGSGTSSPYPTRMTCPHCQAEITTSVQYEAGALTHIVALVLCLVGCYCCCCIPYCVEGCQDAHHKCPNCNHHLGVAKRL